MTADAIHGDLRQSNRERTLADFTAASCPSWWRPTWPPSGLHIECVDVVIHFDPPEDHKAYLHRSGGRPGPARPGRRLVALVEPGGRGRGHPDAASACSCRSSRSSPTTRAWRTWPTATPTCRGGCALSDGVAIDTWTPDDGVRRVLIVTAHPDDVDFGVAGTVATFTKAGLEVTYCIATNGDAGGSDRSVSRSDMAAICQTLVRAAAAEVG